MLADTENDIFIKPFLKRWFPYEYFVRFGGNMHFSQILGDRVVVDRPQSDGKLVLNLIEGENFEVIKTVETTVLTSNKSKYNGDIFIQILGDSYVNGAFFRDAFFSKKYVCGRRCARRAFRKRESACTRSKNRRPRNRLPSQSIFFGSGLIFLST